MPTWVPWASFAMGTIAFFIWHFGMKVAEARRTPKLMADYLPLLEPSILKVVQKSRELADAVREAREDCAAVPPHYRRILDIAIRHAQVCEEHAQEEMAELGTPPLGSIYAGISVERGVQMVPATIPPPPSDGVFEDDEQLRAVTSLPSDRAWIGGQLIRSSAP